MLWGDYVLEKRIAYYTKKVAEYGSIHFTKRRNPYREERILLYKELLNKKIYEHKSSACWICKLNRR